MKTRKSGHTHEECVNHPSERAKPQHTPTPWKATDGKMTSFPDSVYVSAVGRDGFQSVLAIMNTDTNNDHDKQANAAFIVRAVNAHQAMYDALRCVLNVGGLSEELENSVQEAIAKASSH